jgi:magnesium-transporting ATPase (P-type)
MRRSSGVVLRRAGDQGGGLHGILTGRTHALAINCNLANAVTYLITVQFFRAVLLIVPAMFGMQMLSAVSLLIGGLILDTAAIMLFAWAKPADSAVSTSYSIMRRLEKPITYNVANVVSACVSALLVWLSFAFLQILGIVDLSQSMGMGFVSTYLLQGTVFAVTLHEYTSKGRKSLPWSLIISAGLFVLLLGVCMLVPTFAALTGCNHHSFLSVAITFIAPLIYYFTYRILTLRGLNLHK